MCVCVYMYVCMLVEDSFALILIEGVDGGVYSLSLSFVVVVCVCKIVMRVRLHVCVGS